VNWLDGAIIVRNWILIHVVNVTLNETLDGRSQVQQNDRKGVGMAVGPAGYSAGVRHHAVIPEGQGDRAIVFPPDPTLVGNEPADITHYHATNPDFPQQTTADQFFDEAQWESYRKLGRLIAERIFEHGFDDYANLPNEP